MATKLQLQLVVNVLFCDVIKKQHINITCFDPPLHVKVLQSVATWTAFLMRHKIRPLFRQKVIYILVLILAAICFILEKRGWKWWCEMIVLDR